MPLRPTPLRLMTLCLLAMPILPGCDRPDPAPPAAKPATFPAGSTTDPDAPFGAPPLSIPPPLTPSEAVHPEAGPRPAAEVAPAALTVAGQSITFAPAVLRNVGGGVLVLNAESESAGNLFSFQMTPRIDGTDGPPGGADWTHAVWTYQLTSPEEETTDGIRSTTAPDNGLRPVELTVDLQRTGAIVRITLSGRFISLTAPDPLTAPQVEVAGSFDALWLNQPAP